MKRVILLILIAAATSVLAGQDYYKLMGLKRDATDDQIKKAFKKLAIRYHPDKNQDNPEVAKKKF
jgi:DnaJ-class molecular chaperone